jgi:glycosyltransferase involved in cell wall biosynthesis
MNYKLYNDFIPNDFDWEYYIKLNPDLYVLKDEKEAKVHYFKYGIKENRCYKFDNYTKYYLCKDILEYLKLTVIIPNFNNEKYLLKRLDTVYNQTIPPDEIIIIDDCSTDNSVNLIKNYISKKNIDTKLIINNTNSGSGYFNWIKGIEMAKYDLIWIAESDDSCDLNFIQLLIPEFINEIISITYCRTHFVDEKNNVVWKINDYLSDSWNKNFVKTQQSLLNDKFSYLNIIPNVSSCIFRKPGINIINTIKTYLDKNIRLVIDWMFYLIISKNSSISYINNVINYYLLRDESISNKIQKSSIFFDEHFQMMEFMIENFNIKEESINLLYLKLEEHYLQLPHHFKKDINTIKKIYKIDELTQKFKKSSKKEVILIFSYGFIIGGGETFPINLANILYKMNKNVIFMISTKNEINNNIRKLLDRNIRIVNDKSNIENIINDFNITHINTHHHYCDKIVLDYCLKNPNKIKHYITDHGMYSVQTCDSLNLLSSIQKTNSTIIYINDNNLKNFHNINVSKYKIPITIQDYSDYIPIERDNFDIKKNDFIITLASRCFKEKGWKEMIDIMNIINETYSHVKLLLLGDYNNEYGLGLKNNCKNKNILFLGFQDKIKRFFEISDLGVLPTYYQSESNPIVLIECLYAKKPFIVTQIGETHNMLKANQELAGSIIDLDNGKINIEKYVLEIEKYIIDKNYYKNKLKQIDYAIKKFNPEILINEYIKIFNQ